LKNSSSLVAIPRTHIEPASQFQYLLYFFNIILGHLVAISLIRLSLFLQLLFELLGLQLLSLAIGVGTAQARGRPPGYLDPGTLTRGPGPRRGRDSVLVSKLGAACSLCSLMCLTRGPALQECGAVRRPGPASQACAPPSPARCLSSEGTAFMSMASAVRSLDIGYM